MSAKVLVQYAPFMSAGKPAIHDRVPHRERRRRARTNLHWPVLFRYHRADPVASVTENLSSHGFYCLSQTPFTSGELLLCWLTVPTHDPSAAKGTMQVECNVRVVRSEATSEEGLFGIACRIEDYHFGGGEPALPVDSIWKRVGRKGS
jgi:hypothetical protein